MMRCSPGGFSSGEMNSCFHQLQQVTQALTSTSPYFTPPPVFDSWMTSLFWKAMSGQMSIEPFFQLSNGLHLAVHAWILFSLPNGVMNEGHIIVTSWMSNRSHFGGMFCRSNSSGKIHHSSRLHTADKVLLHSVFFTLFHQLVTIFLQ